VKSLILGVDAILPLKNLLTYMKNFWFERVGTARFSVFMEHHRTHNVVESWHRSLNRKMVGKHLTLWKFIGISTLIIDYFLYKKTNKETV
jgi:hypothetical protein